ncbi:SHOCT-like domain-containing protein [Psychrobacillus sp. L4]|uniref:SHOCT-like domain-containing protein n=1 Tax=Psychrobacillus sp. L4 TaxID=3236892 RepID=UPI0036F345EF
MNAEIEKVLNMVQEGKVDAAKASELIQVLKVRESGSTTSPRSTTYADKMLKVRVVSAENDNVNVNLPIKLVKVVLLAGHNIASSIPQSQKYVKDIDISLILDAIENELDGQIVDVRSANGDTISVTIE